MATLDFQDKEVLETIFSCSRKSVQSIFGTILGGEITCIENAEEEASGHGVVGIISLMGDVSCLLMLVLPEKSAKAMALKFTGFEVDYNSADMGDVVGELANVLAGDLVGRLSEKGIKVQMSLPTIMRGENVEPLVPSAMSSRVLGFKSTEGLLLLKVAGSRAGEEICRKPGT